MDPLQITSKRPSIQKNLRDSYKLYKQEVKNPVDVKPKYVFNKKISSLVMSTKNDKKVSVEIE